MSYVKMLCDAWKDRDGLERAMAQAATDQGIDEVERRRVTRMFKERLARVKRLGAHIGPQLRKFIRDRDRDMCRYCGVEGIGRWPGDYALDHVVPVKHGGLTTAGNLVMACAPCNGKKGPRTLEQAGMELRSIPEQRAPYRRHQVLPYGVYTRAGIRR